MQNSFINHIKQRGFFNQSTNQEGIEYLLKKKKVVAYAGFDCTADSLHIGSLVPIMLLRAYQKFGHRPIILLGGGTSLIGDPSGKEETRKILTNEVIDFNKKKLTDLFKKFLRFDDTDSSAIMVDNLDWINDLNYVSFIRDIGSCFSVNKMLSFESVKQRLSRQQNLSFLEFNYSILQAYDFLQLFENYNCEIQFGGSDQWGNIISGIELVKKKTGKELFGLTSPLIMTSDGTKMGKTNTGAIWLTEEKLSSYDYWQYWRNVADEDVIKFLKLFTDLDILEINRYEKLTGSELNKLKIILANEATKICHGIELSQKAEKTSENLFSEKQFDLDLPEKHKIKINKSEINSGLTLKNILTLTNLSSSISESKRLIMNGGVKINDLKIQDKNYLLSMKDFDSKGISKLSIGKKRYGIIKLNN